MIPFVTFVLFSVGVLVGWVLRTVYGVLVKECHDPDHATDIESGW